MNKKETKKERPKAKKLSSEILLLLILTFVIAVFLFWILRICAIVVVDTIIAAREIILTEAKRMVLDGWLDNICLLISVAFFLFLFLFLLGERLSYIRDIIRGIEILRSGKLDHKVPVEGYSELRQLAEAVNYLSDTQQQVKEKERALAEEKEAFIRTLSHDIRTPLTSIMAYSEYLATCENCTVQDRREYAMLIQKKAGQIKELTDILLDGGRRNPEYFEDARFLMEQLAAEFEETLEDVFQVSTDLSDCPAFSGNFDVQELRRVFDNLCSNIQKYADSKQPVTLSVSKNEHQLIIRQRNMKYTTSEQRESYQMGINSIRRVAHNYAGQVEIWQNDGMFEITITLSEY